MFHISDMDHSNMETDPLFKDFKKYIKAKHQLERAKEKVTQCCGRKVVKTEDGQGIWICNTCIELFYIYACIDN